MADYMDTRPDPRDPRDPYRTALGPPVPIVSPSYGQPAPYPPARPPHVDYVQQGEHIVPIPYHDVGSVHPGRGSVPYPPGYPGPYGQPDPREDPSHPAREDSRYDIEDSRHSSRIDPRYPPPGRDDPRYYFTSDSRYTSSRENIRYEDPRERDARYIAPREEPRYPPARDEPRYGQPGYQDLPPRYAHPTSLTSITHTT